MVKIHITGNSGAGKTTLANELSAILDLPAYGLDKIVWQPGWLKTPPELRNTLENELISKPEWIIEGVSKQVRLAADIVIFLDVNRKTSFVRCARRNWKYLFRSRPELPKNCPEILIIPKHVQIIWGFKNNIRPTIIADLKKHDGQVFYVRNTFDREAVLNKLKDSLR